MDDPFDLDRFITAQAPIFAPALAELRRGRKTSHWMWFVFPQLVGLGHSPTAVRYAITGLAEAQAYLAHTVLGPRLTEAIAAMLAAPTDDPVAVLGAVDAVKLRSSLTLFAAAGCEEPCRSALERFYDGRHDPATLRLLGGGIEALGGSVDRDPD